MLAVVKDDRGRLLPAVRSIQLVACNFGRKQTNSQLYSPSQLAANKKRIHTINKKGKMLVFSIFVREILVFGQKNLLESRVFCSIFYLQNSTFFI